MRPANPSVNRTHKRQRSACRLWAGYLSRWVAFDKPTMGNNGS